MLLYMMLYKHMLLMILLMTMIHDVGDAAADYCYVDDIGDCGRYCDVDEYDVVVSDDGDDNVEHDVTRHNADGYADTVNYDDICNAGDHDVYYGYADTADDIVMVLSLMSCFWM